MVEQKMRVMTLRVTEKMLDDLSQMSEDLRLTKCEMIRFVLADYVRKNRTKRFDIRRAGGN